MTTSPQIHRTTIAQLWQRTQSWPMGSRLFSYMLGRQARYTGTIGARVVELSDGHCVVEMDDRPKVRNHLKSVHAIALMNLGELVTGLTVLHQVDGRGRGIVTNLSMDYVKKARGTITGTCATRVPEEVGAHDVTAEGILRDPDGDVVARCIATWKLDLKA